MRRPRCVRTGVPLRPRNTLGVGGAAAHLARPGVLRELREVLAWCEARSLPYRLLGRGSNVLVPEEGLGEVVIQLGTGFETAALEAGRTRAGAAYPLPRLAIEACREGLGGLERFVGVPASLGGAVAMNAGCLGVELCELVRRIRLVDPAGRVGWVEAREMGFSYRSSRLQVPVGLGSEICLEVELDLQPARVGELTAVLRREQRRRLETQPHTLPSAGSAFKNPPGDSAGRLIDQAGLKGLRVGGAEVSALHANFIVNRGGATADEVLELLARVHREVRDCHGVSLEPEIRLWGGLGRRFLELVGRGVPT